MPSLVLIDYGSGNLRSAEKALRECARRLWGAWEVAVTHHADKVAAADKIVLPGVGAFAACMNALAARPGVIEAMTAAVKGRGAPFLGICVGMQLLATRGLEFGETPGLDWIAGDVKRIEPAGEHFKVPHMGWNQLRWTRPHPVCAGVPDGTWFYFVHSYYAQPKSAENQLGESQYGEPFAAAIARNNIIGFQFHPEKSHAAGLRLLANFVSWDGRAD